MLTRPDVVAAAGTVGELRELFRDDHVHMALLVDGGELVGAVERDDLEPTLGDDVPALDVAHLDGRTIRPDLMLAEALALMRRGDRRRLAVTTGDGRLVGLLCLKASGHGFCSDADVGGRRRDEPA